MRWKVEHLSGLMSAGYWADSKADSTVERTADSKAENSAARKVGSKAG